MTKNPPEWIKDELDRRIIRELQRNAREAISNIATRLNVARSTVHERIARMEKNGVITGYSVILSRNPSEEDIQVLVLLEVKQKDTKKILHQISQYSEIRVCLSINGEFDLFISIEAPSIRDIDIIIDEVADITGVIRTKTFVVFGRRFDRRYKESVKRITKQVSGENLQSDGNTD